MEYLLLAMFREKQKQWWMEVSGLIRRIEDAPEWRDEGLEVLLNPEQKSAWRAPLVVAAVAECLKVHEKG